MTQPWDWVMAQPRSAGGSKAPGEHSPQNSLNEICLREGCRIRQPYAELRFNWRAMQRRFASLPSHTKAAPFLRSALFYIRSIGEFGHETHKTSHCNSRIQIRNPMSAHRNIAGLLTRASVLPRSNTRIAEAGRVSCFRVYPGCLHSDSISYLAQIYHWQAIGTVRFWVFLPRRSPCLSIDTQILCTRVMLSCA
jgi:hypothetical protein